MISLINISKSQTSIAEHLRDRRLAKGWTQQGLAERSGVSLPSLRKFEQKGVISLTSFLKLANSLDCLEAVLNATQPNIEDFSSIDEVLEDAPSKKPQRGWRK